LYVSGRHESLLNQLHLPLCNFLARSSVGRKSAGRARQSNPIADVVASILPFSISSAISIASLNSLPKYGSVFAVYVGVTLPWTTLMLAVPSAQPPARGSEGIMRYGRVVRVAMITLVWQAAGRGSFARRLSGAATTLAAVLTLATAATEALRRQS
jgi:hypothetical protein